MYELLIGGTMHVIVDVVDRRRKRKRE